MDIRSVPIPHISISLAPPEEIPAEPYSPFNKTSFNVPQHDDGFRPVHLTPPPVHTKFLRTLSPLSSSEQEPARPTGRGLDQARFEALLNASKDKLVPAKRTVDLRKEVALKAHKHKQAERRALFLSKVLAPPSPTAAATPVTPPDSPAIFHYSLPSPGLVSPIAHYESLHDEDSDEGLSSYLCKPWVEQVDFKLLSENKTKNPRLSSKPRQPLPSLEQISARLNHQRSLRAHDSLNENVDIQVQQAAQPSLPEQHPRLVVGRLRMPVRAASGPKITISTPPVAEPRRTAADLPITTLAVPRPHSISPTELTRVNLLALNSRESRSSTMLTTLRRRTQSSGTYGFSPLSLPQSPTTTEQEARKGMRRHSAPPETIALRERKGFEHPVLALPGAF